MMAKLTDFAMLHFELPRDGRAQILLCDVLGREIAILEETWMAFGHHELSVSLPKVPAGTYIVRMRQGDTAASSPLVVVR